MASIIWAGEARPPGMGSEQAVAEGEGPRADQLSTQNLSSCLTRSVISPLRDRMAVSVTVLAWMETTS